jgi:hypothetical protein
MNIEDIKSLISETLQQSELALQVNQTGQQLSIVMNRPNNLEVDYEKLATKILETLLEKLSPEDLTSIEAIKFFGRIKGQPKQEWQKLQKLNGLPQKKIEPIAEADLQSPPVTALATPTNERTQPLTTSSRYQSVQTPINSSSSAWDLINDFKFGKLFIDFKDIISTGALVGIFTILLINLLGGQKPQAVSWEYKIEAISDLIFIESMDGYGKNGWELVSARRAVTDGVASYECIFKRVKK